MEDLKPKIGLIGRVLNDPYVPLHRRFRALFTLRNIGGEDAIKEIARGFSDPSVLLTHELAYCLGQMQDKKAIPFLIKVLEDQSMNPITRHEAGEALGAIGSTEALDVLRKYLQDPEAPVAETCELAIQRIEWLSKRETASQNSIYDSVDPAPSEEEISSIDDLVSVLLDEKKSLFERYKALFSLRNINTTESILGLTKGLTVGSALFRHEVAFVLGQIQNPVTIPMLTASLADTTQHEMVRHECVEALGSIGTEECSEILKKYLNDPSQIVRDSCVVALDMADHEQSGEFQYANALQVVA
uniref:Deoxyhypusine hydroxylase n=1 Tax=Lygus hesperus TaxID=30085 RepID=A0A0A9XGK2_LYGHE